MSEDLIKRSDAIAELWDMTTEDCPNPGAAVGKCMETIRRVPSADRPKHYCAECKYEPIDKRCAPCSSCTNNPKNRDAFVSCEVEKKGEDDADTTD